ncbi:OLC1v1035057C1 [Oldenlandia corymbosa var. corymbosa]|uniref:OLC1v1035057C1 n=1 Tax=Oldenlandia corymbosa var. corymbosa TaxID=529605 RepID=A0AAV1CV59_OLDCO|nr:OLC1v1035057C1 [Oldenlandia corymbosa var. corymbosa]
MLDFNLLLLNLTPLFRTTESARVGQDADEDHRAHHKKIAEEVNVVGQPDDLLLSGGDPQQAVMNGGQNGEMGISLDGIVSFSEEDTLPPKAQGKPEAHMIASIEENNHPKIHADEESQLSSVNSTSDSSTMTNSVGLQSTPF